MFLSNSLAEPQAAGGWIKWFHEGIPDEPEWLRTIIRAIAAIFGHCQECTAILGCYFAGEPNKCPEHPLHDGCH